MKKLITILILTLTVATTQAQNKKVTFTGAGRTVIQSDQFGGDFIQDNIIGTDTLPGDSITARRALTGYALFDLGFDIRPNTETEIMANFRVANDLDGFWGGGVQFFVRQLYVKGLVKNIVKYQIGDIQTQLTPFTLFNNDADLGRNHPYSFNVFSDIIEYENFYMDNTWRQQGAQVDFALSMPKVIDEISFKGLISKNRQTDFFFTPDRLMGLSQVGFIKEDIGRINYNYVNLFDVASSAQFGGGSDRIAVQSLDFELNPELPLNMKLTGELGFSNFTNVLDEEKTKSDPSYFAQASVHFEIPESDFQGEIGFRSVESGFRSPGAQSRRNAYSLTNSTLPFYTNTEVTRTQTLADLYKDTRIYNQLITSELAPFNPIYENINPYGIATPNRSGLDVELAYVPDSSVISSIEVKANILKELTGEGIANLRSFTGLELNAAFALNRIWGSEKDQLLSLRARSQSTSRDGLSGIGEAVDGIGEMSLSSMLLEAGVSIEFADDLDLLLSMVNYGADGNEFIAQRDENNSITDYSVADYDVTESIYVIGTRYRYSPTVQLTVQYQISNYKNELDPSNAYDWNQFMVLFNMFF